MTFVNVGTVPASGRTRLAVAPDSSATLIGKKSFRFDSLAPGATQKTTIQMRLEPDAETVTIESIPGSPSLVPAMFHLLPSSTADAQ